MVFWGAMSDVKETSSIVDLGLWPWSYSSWRVSRSPVGSVTQGTSTPFLREKSSFTSSPSSSVIRWVHGSSSAFAPSAPIRLSLALEAQIGLDR